MAKPSDTELIELRDFIYRKFTEDEYKDILIRLDLYSLDDIDREHGEYSGLSKRQLIELTLRELRDRHQLGMLLEELPDEAPLGDRSIGGPRESGEEPLKQVDDAPVSNSGSLIQPTAENELRSKNRNKIKVAVIGAFALLAVPVMAFFLPRLFPPEPPEEGTVSPAPTLPPSQTSSITASSPPMVPTSSSGMVTGCLSGGEWHLFGPTVRESSEGCLPLPSAWGVSVVDDGLSVFRQSADKALEAAIYRPFIGDTVIRFRFSVQEMTTVGNHVANIVFGVSSTNPPQAPEEAFFFQKEGPEFPILLKLNQYGADFRIDGERVELTQGAFKQIELIVEGNALSLFMDGQQIAGPIEINPKDRAFWVSWKIPKSASLQFELNDLDLTDN